MNNFDFSKTTHQNIDEGNISRFLLEEVLREGDLLDQNIDYDDILDDFIRSISKKANIHELDIGSGSEKDLNESMVLSDGSDDSGEKKTKTQGLDKSNINYLSDEEASSEGSHVSRFREQGDFSNVSADPDFRMIGSTTRSRATSIASNSRSRTWRRTRAGCFART